MNYETGAFRTHLDDTSFDFHQNCTQKHSCEILERSNYISGSMALNAWPGPLGQHLSLSSTSVNLSQFCFDKITLFRSSSLARIAVDRSVESCFDHEKFA